MNQEIVLKEPFFIHSIDLKVRVNLSEKGRLAHVNFGLSLPKLYIKDMANQVEGKDVAIIAHITLVGMIIALIMNSNNRTDFGSYHLRQTIGLWLTGVIGSFIPFVNFVIWLLILINWIVGIINAINGNEKPMPILGKQYAQWFKGV